MAINLSIPTATLGAGPGPVMGQVRYNTLQHRVETWSGAQWIPIAQAHEYPETWQEWFDYYINCSFGMSADRHSCHEFIEQEMKGRFPGNYQVGIDIVNDKWIMMFDTPEDETWFNLQYL